MLTLHLYLEDFAGDWIGWIEGFPGATSQGATPEEVVRQAPTAMLEYVQWLQRHAEPVPPRLQNESSYGLRPEIAAIHHPRAAQEGVEIHGFFAPDRRPLDAEELAQYLRLFRFACADLRSAVCALPPDEWDSAPFGGKSVRTILQHLAASERDLLRCLGVEPQLESTLDPRVSLEDMHHEFEKAVETVSQSQRGEAVLIQGERWTLRKILRRAVWHTRYHAIQIAGRSNPTAFLRSAVVQIPWRDAGVPVLQG
jgi:predicted RNase H-like HicB family nuclease